MTLRSTIDFISESLRDFELYPKVSSMLDYIVDQGYEQYGDVDGKFKNPNLKDELIDEIIFEYGFEYVNEIASRLNNVDKAVLVQFISLLHLLKGHRSGLELVFEVLGFNSILEEWWEQSPKGTPMTYNAKIFIDFSNLTEDVFVTIERLKRFSRFYVYPIFEVAELVFDFEFTQTDTAIAGFTDQELNFEIEATL